MHEYVESLADEFVNGDLRDPQFIEEVIDKPFDELYQLAADMGGAGFVFSGENDADIMPMPFSTTTTLCEVVYPWPAEARQQCYPPLLCTRSTPPPPLACSMLVAVFPKPFHVLVFLLILGAASANLAKN